MNAKTCVGKFHTNKESINDYFKLNEAQCH